MQGSKVLNSAIAKKPFVQTKQRHHKEGVSTVTQLTPELWIVTSLWQSESFNCTGSRHRASECKCRSGCQICSRRHLTSICDKPTSRDQLMTTTSIEQKGVVYPMVTVDVNGVSHGHSWREWCIPWSQLTWMVLSVEHCWIREPEAPTLNQRFWTVYICVLSVNNSSALK